ncbi:RNA polymerase sigma factor [Neolewinella antarctica]|uniref:RNA polymerase sigma-70 factor (ECF subfamily) n=1 Tax=Neolewinella antarctica TaxID=442734 RepID=A0ABX0XFP2_9BACT|nr:sigma-70 family RNA polymerase sigma factor [Neolewinella antarctica]NJC27950.1 RNA polymerase sigma-70 factor (ECF subfamily) [Neolewinella antarctica]
MLSRPKKHPDTKSVKDSDLLARFQTSGATADLLPLYQRHAEFIYALALRYLTTPQRAEDAGAEIWSVLLEKLPRHEVTNFKSWLHTTVRNHCLMQLRREKRDPLQQPVGGDVQSGDLLHLSVEDGEETIDTRPLHRCLKKLKAEQRHCVNLFYLREGETYQSIAASLELSVGQVRSHLQNGRRNLKKCLDGTNE